MTFTPPPPPPPSPSPTPARHRSWTSRTSLITVAAIAGVVLAGTAAVAANIGILNATDDTEIGELAATEELVSDPQVDFGAAAAPTAEQTAANAANSGEIHRFDIDSAGSVWVVTTRSGIALDHVETLAGWTSTLSQGDFRSLQVDFAGADRTIVFSATLQDDGTVAVDVTEPATAGWSDDDEHEKYEEHDEHEDHDHEGADDDD